MFWGKESVSFIEEAVRTASKTSFKQDMLYGAGCTALGMTAGTLTALLQKLPVNPSLKVEAYRYLRKIEEGTPISDVPREEREAFKRVMEKIKEELWRRRERLSGVADEILYTSSSNPEETAKAIVGLLHDLTLIYSGEKSPKELGMEREALQIYHTLRNLEEKGHYVDPDQLARTLSRIV